MFTSGYYGAVPRVAGVGNRVAGPNTARVSATPESRPGAERPLPSGTVTFVFTDIEGSSERWERAAPAMQDALRRHDALVRSAIVEHAGHVFKTVGDAFCAAFSRPADAVAAIVAAQSALAAEDFSAVGGLAIRAAIHTGMADERDGDYFGAAVNRVARLLAVGHAGQTIVSGVTADLVQGALPDRTSLRDLGEHRLKDLTHAEQVYQVVAAGLRESFPPLRSLQSLPNNLPLQLTSFVGREEEVAEIAGLLATSRLVTLVGTGGVGKTRTALQVAAEMLDGSGDGVWFVDLAPLRDPAMLAQEVLNVFGLAAPPDKTPIQVLLEYLRARRLLIVLDNCEHVVAAAASTVDAILRGCPGVSILATSREGLNVSGERVYRMPSLALPPEGPLTAAQGAAYGAVALFAERACAADGRFALTDANAAIVAEVCRRLDGIALAIELAAPRVKVLAVDQLARRLDERFRILTGGSRSALPRQQTMRALIDWSYDLLSDREKVVFRRTGVFVGGFTLEAAVAVCSADAGIDEWEVLDVLSILVDKSLVAAEIQGSQQRYRLLESVRDYARTRLVELGELDQIMRSHAAHFLAYAEARRAIWGVTPTGQWVEPMVPEMDNFRAALSWSLKHDPPGAADLAAALHRFFDRLALQEEGLRWIERAMDANQTLPQSVEAALMRARGTLFLNQGRMSDAREAGLRSLELARAIGDEAQIIHALLFMSSAEPGEERVEFTHLVREGVERAERFGDELLIAEARGVHAGQPGLPKEESRALFDASVGVYKRLKRDRDAALMMMRRLVYELDAEDTEFVVQVGLRCCEMCADEPTMHIRSLGMLAHAQLRVGDRAGALATSWQRLALATASYKPHDARSALSIVLGLQDDVRDPILHAKLLGYVNFLEDHLTMAFLFRRVRPLHAEAVARVVALIGQAAFEEYAREGQGWDAETAYREALKL
jgi:predicted ATPase/class 3 adenylate cyclase